MIVAAGGKKSRDCLPEVESGRGFEKAAGWVVKAASYLYPDHEMDLVSVAFVWHVKRSCS